ncbi:unnamed protein product [Caenorhabditis angaria]|uniref:Uncharacterized protein n=1 Tax=Caenorhabditis angaria TaxID=860376 RepID=A0A9P1N7Q2_9PELO|nr:unnamed protein product [Caenorhabditis angaria]
MVHYDLNQENIGTTEPEVTRRPGVQTEPEVTRRPGVQTEPEVTRRPGVQTEPEVTRRPGVQKTTRGLKDQVLTKLEAQEANKVLKKAKGSGSQRQIDLGVVPTKKDPFESQKP